MIIERRTASEDQTPKGWYKFFTLILLANAAAFSQPTTFVVDRIFGNFSNAVSLSINAGGDLFVLDAGNNLLMKFSKEGQMLKTIGGRGWGDLEFDQPTDVCATFHLDVYVDDYNNRRVQRFDRSMNFVQTLDAQKVLQSEGGAFYPRACAISSQGELFIVDSDGEKVIKMNQQQRFEREFGSYSAGKGRLMNPRDIAITEDGNVWVLDAHRAVGFDVFGNYVSTLAFDSLLVPLTVSSYRDGLVVTSSDMITAYAPDGKKKFVVLRSSLIGVEGPFRDAMLVSDHLYILTEKEVAVTISN